MSKISLSPSPTGSAVYTIASPAGSTDRTLTLPDNAGTVLSSASTFAGTNQTWQDVSASRDTGVTYTNTTGFPIQVSTTGGGTGINVSLRVDVDGVQAGFAQVPTVSGQTVRCFVTAVVPAGSTYVVTRTGGAFIVWAELR